MADLAAQQIVGTGLEATYAAADESGDSVPAGTLHFLHVKNGGGAPVTVTVVTAKTVAGLGVDDQEVVVTDAEERFIGPLTPALYADANGDVEVLYSAVDTVTVAVLSL